MAYNETLANRVREMIALITDAVEEKKMFGGLCFMVNDKMCVGIKPDSIMVKISPESFSAALEEEGFTPMVRNGKNVVGFGFISEDVLTTKKQLQYWINLALEYNQTAKSIKKRK
jgi:TfoX/Sxy family transcriptional regulator of competence genes